MTRLVLVVEDNEDDRQIYGMLLWYNGFDILFAVDADMGWRLAHEAKPDLVLLDLGLPDMDGIELCRRLSADPRTASIPVLVLTARLIDEYGERAYKAGCKYYLEKPIPPLDVVHEVERLIGRPDIRPARSPRPEGPATVG